jgi:hypothetical protein
MPSIKKAKMENRRNSYSPVWVIAFLRGIEYDPDGI